MRSTLQPSDVIYTDQIAATQQILPALACLDTRNSTCSRTTSRKPKELITQSKPSKFEAVDRLDLRREPEQRSGRTYYEGVLNEIWVSTRN